MMMIPEQARQAVARCWHEFVNAVKLFDEMTPEGRAYSLENNHGVAARREYHVHDVSPMQFRVIMVLFEDQTEDDEADEDE